MLTKEGQACVEEAGFGAIHPTQPKEFKVKTLSYYDGVYAKDGTELIYIDADYPQVSKKNSSKFIDSLNKTFESLTDDFLDSVNELTDGILEYYDELSEDEKEFLPYESYMYYDVTRNYDGIFSVTVNESFYTGGAHPFGDRISFTYDTNKEKELTLCDILGKSQKETDKFVIEKFYAEYDEEDLWDLEEEAPNVYFLIENDELVLYFQQYQIGPYAMGFPEVRISLDELK